eukprot:TRINITY_DN2963_c0_g4_i2.p2 TRINITY_DN2963_c0_g4~~TRINITY_DN2963_c0_g4_i2.p2  ORF type:complete len:133 (-),score=37.45 TRINITY_DN2963_c0_g4_i2:69-467(-)
MMFVGDVEGNSRCDFVFQIILLPAKRMQIGGEEALIGNTTAPTTDANLQTGWFKKLEVFQRSTRSESLFSSNRCCSRTTTVTIRVQDANNDDIDNLSQEQVPERRGRKRKTDEGDMIKYLLQRMFSDLFTAF